MMEQQQVQAVQQAQRGNGKGSRALILRTGIIIGIVVEVVAVLLHIFGTVSVFGETLNPIRAGDKILQIFSYRSANGYRYIFNLLFGVGYFVLYIPILHNFFHMCKSGKLIRSKDVLILYNCMLSFMRSAFASIFYQIILAGLAVLFTGSAFPSLAIFGMVLASICFVLRKLLANIAREQQSAFQIIISFLKDSICCALAFLLIGMFERSYGQDAINGIKMMFNGYMTFEGGAAAFAYVLYTSLIENILLCIFFIFTLYTVNKVFFYGKASQRGAVVKTLIFAVVLAVCIFVFHVFLSYDVARFDVGMLKEWLADICSFILPCILLLIGILTMASWGNPVVPEQTN